jgi:hypothetical protein
VFVAGDTLGAFPGFANAAHIAQIYVTSYGPNGKQSWLQQVTSGSGDHANDLLTDAAGDVVVCGSTLGAYPGFSNPTGTREALILKLSGTGTLIWAQQFAVGADAVGIEAAALSSTGVLVVGGEAVPSGSSQYQNVFFAGIDMGTGQVLWRHELGTRATDLITAATADSTGGIYFSGTSSGGFPGSSMQNVVPFVAKISAPDGAVAWAHNFTADSYHRLLASIAQSPDGTIVIGGARSNDSLIVGQAAAPGASAMLMKLSQSTGATIWEQTYSTGNGDQISSVSVLGDGTIYAAGSTNGTFSTSFSQPLQDLFLLKLTSAGYPVWVQQFGNGSIVNVTGLRFGLQVAADSMGDALLGGITQGAYSGASNPSSAVEAFAAKFGP